MAFSFMDANYYTAENFVAAGDPVAVKQSLSEWFKKKFQSNYKNETYAGLFTSDNTFELRTRWQLYMGRQPFQDAAPLKGTIFPGEKGSTNIMLQERRRRFRWYMIIPIPVLLAAYGFVGHHATATSIVPAMMLTAASILFYSNLFYGNWSSASVYLAKEMGWERQTQNG